MQLAKPDPVGPSRKNTVRNSKLIALGLIILVLSLLGGIIAIRTSHTGVFNINLRNAIKQGKSSVPVASLTNFDWERVCYIGSYADPKRFSDMERRELFEKGKMNFFWVGSDTEWGLIFKLSNGETIGIPITLWIAHTPYDRILENAGYKDLVKYQPFCFSREEASLILIREERSDYAFLVGDR